MGYRVTLDIPFSFYGGSLMDELLFHPKTVHLPLALGMLMPLIAGGVLFAWWRKWLPARAWVIAVVLQALLAASGFVAQRSGEGEEHRVEKVVDEEFVHRHERAAENFVWASVGVFLVMALALPLLSRRVGAIAAIVATLGTLIVFALGYRTGQAGGELVYRHGATRAYLE
jgi:hypothetical protein